MTRSRTQSGFSFLEVIIAMSVLIVGSVSVLGLFALGVNRMVERRVAARTEQMRPEIGSILQSAVDMAGPGKLPPKITREQPHQLSRRGYALAVTWETNTFGNAPGYFAHAELLYQGKPVNFLVIPVRRSFLRPEELVAAGESK